MKKLKYILASVVLATAFTSCETEAIDEKLKDETVAGKPILRFELNDKQTIVTDKVQVEFKSPSRFAIKARFSIPQEEMEPETAYKSAKLTVEYSQFIVANFPTILSLENPSNLTSSAVLEIVGEGVYATKNASENQSAGFSNITKINEQAKYLEGNFEYILYPEVGQPLDAQRITKGKFDYVQY